MRHPPTYPSLRKTGVSRHLGIMAGLALAGLAGCDSASPAKGVSTGSSARTAQIQVRVDLPSAGSPAVSLLAFRAQATDIPAANVLSAVDPLAAPPPAAGCELRELSAPARQLRAQGGTVNLHELEDVAVEVSVDKILRPMPRVYPPLADVVGGVIGEAGPTNLDELPPALTLVTGPSQRTKIAVPASPSLRDSTLAPLSSRAKLDASGDVVVGIEGTVRGFLEIRPFGAPAAIACTANARGWVVVPHDLLERLTAGTAGAPVAFEAVARDSQLMDAGGELVHVSVETRSQVVLELVP